MARSREPFKAVLGPLMSMIVLPYLGARAASSELTRKPPATQAQEAAAAHRQRPAGGSGHAPHLSHRARAHLHRRIPCASNREIAEGAGIADQGQISKLLTRLERLELVHNIGEGQIMGSTDEWYLTDRGGQVERATRPR